METQKMTSQFSEIIRAMPQSKKVALQRGCLNLQTPISFSSINYWAYTLNKPATDIRIKLVADILRDMGYDVDPDTLFKKYPKPVKTVQQEK